MGYWNPLPVRLDPRHDAYFGLQATPPPANANACPAVPYLLVTPPDDRLPDVTYADLMGKTGPVFRPCGLTVTASPVVPHAALLMGAGMNDG